MSAVTVALPSVKRLLFVAPLIAFALFVSFWNLGAPSISAGDESIHVRVVQEMIETGRWLSPTLDGEPYLGKPPLKLALSKCVVLMFGDSNLAFRSLDGLAGFCTILLTYALALRMFRSAAVAALAALLLSINRVFLFSHVVREAVQDSMLLLLTTAALFIGWELLASRAERQEASALRRSQISAALVGVLSGLAILTKSVAGLFPLIIFYAALILREGIGCFFLRSSRVVWLPAVCALVVALPYYALSISLIPEAAQQMITVNLQERLLTKGFHHPKQWDLYLKLVFRSGRVAPVGLVLIGLLAGFLGCARRDARYQYLMVWVILPLVAMSALRSRLDWYLAPAFPGLAILSAAGLVAALSRLTDSARVAPTASRRVLPMIGCLLLASYMGATVSQRALDISQRVLHDGPAGAFEKISRAIRARLQVSDHAKKVALFGLTDALSPKNAPFNLHKKIYLSMLGPYSVNVDSLDELTEIKRNGSLAFVVAPASARKELQALSPCAIRLIPGRVNKNPAEPGSWPAVAVAAFVDCESFKRL